MPPTGRRCGGSTGRADRTCCGCRRRDEPFVALSPDGGRLYAIPDMRVHDLRSGRQARFYRRPPGPEWGSRMDLSPDGRWLAFGAGLGRGTAVIDTRSLQEVRRLGEGSSVVEIRFSADSSRLLTSSWGAPRPTQVWEVASGRLLADLSLTGRSPMAVDLDASGATVVSAEAHKQIDLLRRWDVTGADRYLRRIRIPDLPLGDAGACLRQGVVGRAPASRTCPAAQDSYVFLDVAQRRCPGRATAGDGVRQRRRRLATGRTHLPPRRGERGP